MLDSLCLTYRLSVLKLLLFLILSVHTRDNLAMPKIRLTRYQKTAKHGNKPSILSPRCYLVAQA